MTEERANYHAGPTDSAEPPLATEDLVALAHARRQSIPYETGEPLLAAARVAAGPGRSRPERAGENRRRGLCAAALVEMIEKAPGEAGPRWH